MLRKMVSCLLGILLMAAIVFFCTQFTSTRANEQEEGVAAETQAEAAKGVSVISVERAKDVRRILTYPGRVYAFQKSILTFRVGGPLLEICVEPGDHVHRGQKLMQIDPRDYQIQLELAQSKLASARANLEAMKKGARPEDIALLETSVEQARATYDLAKNEFERCRQLVERRAVSASEYDTAYRTFVNARLSLEAAQKELEKGKAGARREDIQAAEAEIRGLEASLQAAKNDLADTILVAPYDGIITTRKIEPYEMVTVSPSYKEVLGIHDISRLKIEVFVPEKEMASGKFVKGLTVPVTFHVQPNRQYPAELYEIDTQPTDVGLTYKLTFVLNAPKETSILPGMIAEVSIPEFSSATLAEDSLVVPASAVMDDHVWIVNMEHSTVSKRTIVRGPLVAGDRYVVYSGLQEGEKVVTEGARFLHEGETVQIMIHG
ncbi:MAG: efflux RND transporter periplasmic adaptor subunit [Planctomycetia bacterium]|nr:efflux RND transporter periplasmic adaptor subunit [Planctomycetia bacterium]